MSMGYVTSSFTLKHTAFIIITIIFLKHDFHLNYINTLVYLS